MRLDIYLTQREFAETRSKAQYLISSGLVTVDGKTVTKPSFDVDGRSVCVLGDGLKYVSRGALKLEGALIAFNVSPVGCKCVDIGSSTGGFTDCLLQAGADKVFCVDSGSEQLHPRLRSDARVTLRERFNARSLTLEDVGYQADLVVMDVSFISQKVLYPNVINILAEDGLFISLVKPQFEAGKDNIGKGGIVRSPKVRKAVVDSVIDCARGYGLYAKNLIVSPIAGGDGNIEYLVCFTKKREDEKEVNTENIFPGK